jgi:hypothetical protein
MVGILTAVSKRWINVHQAESKIRKTFCALSRRFQALALRPASGHHAHTLD